jgi:hypothetical protein
VGVLVKHVAALANTWKSARKKVTNSTFKQCLTVSITQRAVDVVAKQVRQQQLHKTTAAP